MSWLIRRNGRTGVSPCVDRVRHKDAGADGGGGAGDTGEGHSTSGRGGGPVSTGAGDQGMSSFGGGRDIFGGTNKNLMGSAEQAITPKGYGTAEEAAVGTPGWRGRLADIGQKALLGGITLGMGPLSLAGMGGVMAKGAERAGKALGGSSGVAPAGVGVGGPGRSAGPGGAAGREGGVATSVPPTVTIPTVPLGVSLAANDPTSLAMGLPPDAHPQVMEEAKELKLRLKLFEMALKRVTTAQGVA